MVCTPGGTILDAGPAHGSSQKPPRARHGLNSPGHCDSGGKDAVSITRSNIRTRFGTPGKGAQPGDSGGSSRFSFGCMLSLAKSSPSEFLRQPHQAGTPSLFFGAGKHCDSVATAESEDIPKDKDQSAESVFLDLDLLRYSADDIDATISGLSSESHAPQHATRTPCLVLNGILKLLSPCAGAQRQQVQRLLCNPRVLLASSESFEVLNQLPALKFLILSLDGYQADAESDLWAGLPKLIGALQHVVCLDMSNCLMKDQYLQVRLCLVHEVWLAS